jgi:hypothetical protein
MEFEFSWKILEKYSNIVFYENVPSGSRIIPCDHTDSRNEAKSLFAILRSP